MTSTAATSTGSLIKGFLAKLRLISFNLSSLNHRLEDEEGFVLVFAFDLVVEEALCPFAFNSRFFFTSFKSFLPSTAFLQDRGQPAGRQGGGGQVLLVSGLVAAVHHGDRKCGTGSPLPVCESKFQLWHTQAHCVIEALHFKGSWTLADLSARIVVAEQLPTGGL